MRKIKLIPVLVRRNRNIQERAKCLVAILWIKVEQLVLRYDAADESVVPVVELDLGVEAVDTGVEEADVSFICCTCDRGN